MRAYNRGILFCRKERLLMRTAAAALVLVGVSAAAGVAADLQPRTVAAFDRYVQATEAQATSDPFLLVDRLPESERRKALAELGEGQVFMGRVATREGGKVLDVPGGLIHHWVGTVFVPGTTVDQALGLLQDYDRHEEVFRPNIARSKLVSRDGDMFRVFLRFHMKKVITVVVNTDNEARFSRLASDRAQSRIYSLRVAQVENPGTPEEREHPVGRDGGFLWRLYTYWRFLERDGGTYVQCEAISLTRGIPIGFGWLIGPFVTSIPRESLAFTLARTRTSLGPQRSIPTRVD